MSKQGARLAVADSDMHALLDPSLYQINTRVWLTELSRALGRPAADCVFPDGAGRNLDTPVEKRQRD